MHRSQQMHETIERIAGLWCHHRAQDVSVPFRIRGEKGTLEKADNRVAQLAGGIGDGTGIRLIANHFPLLHDSIPSIRDEPSGELNAFS